MTRARAVAVAGCAALAIYLCAVLIEPLRRADDQAKQFASAHQLNDRARHHGLPILEHLMFALVVTSVIVLAIVIAVLAVQRRRDHEDLLRAAAIPLVALALVEAGKLVLPRPSQAYEPWWLAGRTFPSGHAATGVACLLALFALARRRARLAPLLAGGVAVFLIGVVLSGQHRPSDAAGGLLVALLALWAVGPLALAHDGDGAHDADTVATPRPPPRSAVDDDDPILEGSDGPVLDIRTTIAIVVVLAVVMAIVAAVMAPKTGALVHIDDADGSFSLLAGALLLLAVAGALAASDDSELRTARTTAVQAAPEPT